RFAGSHGLGEGGGAHESHPFTVTGILAPTGSVLDRLIVTPLESVWQVHGVSVAAAVPDKDRHAHHEQDAHRDVGREITALLLQYATPLAAATLQRHVNSQSQLQAASPAAELSRLFGYLGSGAQVIKGIALALLAIGAAGIFAGLGSALSDRAADLALLRLLGAPRRVVVLAVLLQGLLLGIAGVILGLALGHGAAERISALFAQRQGAGFDAWQAAPGEPWLLAGTLALALLAAAVPAWRVYRRAMPQWLARL
ncbi:MAG TPA: FtsX-like permease family protein, partial [Usitatibacteraceae bacterium]|nr:FtsX-like permease family protein [Usitatibacteraceae bacterium]